MNTIWSDHIQNIGTLYYSRTLKFSDAYKEPYQNAFCIGNHANILEIGCGPGALTQSLARWYPDSTVTGVDL
ncbi:MAG: class I SAM-dependent methyltransferase [Lachnospiraceae bacterium]|nr:class I SAM-dependent methyltransferase [Lachnospiraceae bacterium]